MEVLHTIKEFIVETAAHPVLLFLSAFVFSWNCLNTLIRLSYKKNKGTVWIFLFSVINAGIVVLWSFNEVTPHPFALVIVPAVLILNLILLTKDTWWAYLNYFFLTLLDEFSLYGISSALVTIVFQNPWPIGSQEHRRVLLVMTFVMASGIFIMIPRSKAVSVTEQSALFHSREKGKILFGSIVGTSVVLLTSALFILNLIYDDTLPRHAHVMINADLFLKNSLILIFSFLIIMFHVWQDRKQQEMVAIDSELKKERQFRENSQEDAILRFCFDLSLGEITEGEWFFKDLEEEYDRDAASVLNDFRENGICQDDQARFIPLRELEEYREKLEVPFYTFNVRLSVDYLMCRMNLQERVSEYLKELDKEWLWTKVQITIVEDEESGDILCHLSFTDIDAEMTQSENLLQEATTDALTGVYNRSSMEKAMMELFQTSRVTGAFFMIDMDHFKSVNDTLGHPKGDKVLQETAEILRTVFRGRDIICRLGGDEFCVFASRFTDVELICQRCEELNARGRIDQYSEDGSKKVHTSFSVGIAICNEEMPADSYEELYGRADLALYEAKKAGRDTYRIYSKEMEDA
ncbi:MAG: GGDEF domain-containing protein [Lachnospiraceae bacterium]|nr:GGDEF domain-containing protein [Lachnospiraceae bacterium]